MIPYPRGQSGFKFCARWPDGRPRQERQSPARKIWLCHFHAYRMSTSGKNVILWTAYINFLFLGNQEHLNICIFIYVYIYIFVYLYICICVYLYILRNYVRVEVEQRRAECRETLLAQLVAMRPSSL